DHVVTAAYNGDSTFAAANAVPITFHSKRLTSTSVTADNVSMVFGQAETFTAIVDASGDPISGTVDFFVNGAKINPAPVPVNAGRAQFGPYTLHTGSYTITAQYSGDANCVPSTSAIAPLGVTVRQSPTQIGAPQLSGSPVFGPMSFTAAITAPNVVVASGT